MSDKRVLATWAYLSELPFQQWSLSQESQSLIKAFGPTGTIESAQERFDFIEMKRRWAASNRGQATVTVLLDYPVSLSDLGFAIPNETINDFMIVWASNPTPYQFGALNELAWASGHGVGVREDLLFFVIPERDLWQVRQIVRSTISGAAEPPPPTSDNRILTTWVFLSRSPFHQWSPSMERDQLIKAFSPSGTLELAQQRYDELVEQAESGGFVPEEEQFEEAEEVEEVVAPSGPKGWLEATRGFFRGW